jgi:hypothetical protein
VHGHGSLFTVQRAQPVVNLWLLEVAPHQ